METILLPSDFSDNSRHAIRYALELNKKLHAKVILFNSFVIPVYSTDVPLVAPTDNELRSASQESLDKLCAEMKLEFPGQEIGTYIRPGYAEDEIGDAASDKKAGMVIMGTQGASGLKEAIVGTITASVMDGAPCPVMAVPERAKYRPLEKIVFATNYAEGDFDNVERVIEFAKIFVAEVIMLHISSGEYEKTYEFDAIERFKERVSEDSKYDKVTFKLLENKNIYEGLNLYLGEVNASMFAMSMRKRSFIQKIFRRSMTHRMAYHTHIPMIAFRTKG